MNQFGVYFSSSGTPTALTTLTDSCPLGVGKRCTSSCNPHHKNAKYTASVLNELVGSTTNRVVYWTNHALGTYCEHNSDGTCILLNNGGEILAGVYREYYPRVIQFFHLLVETANADEYKACMGVTLIHETAHTFGVPDTYNFSEEYISEHGNEGYQCVMEHYQKGDTVIEFYNKIQNGENAFCSFCAGLVEDALQ